MVNLIGNTCIPSWITTKCIGQQLINPFAWCLMNFDSCYNLVKYFDTINFDKFKLCSDDQLHFSILIDDKVVIEYVHYHFDPASTQIRRSRNDVYFARIWEFITSKYIERTTRMIKLKIPPVFIFACANNRHISYSTNTNVDFSVEQQKMLLDIDQPYRIVTSYRNNYIHPDCIEQDQLFDDNGIVISKYIWNKIQPSFCPSSVI